MRVSACTWEGLHAQVREACGVDEGISVGPYVLVFLASVGAFPCPLGSESEFVCVWGICLSAGCAFASPV